MGYRQRAKTAAPDDPQQAYSYAVFLLSLRARTERELVDRLGQRGYAPGAVELTMGRLRELGYVNDQDYLTSYLSGLKARGVFGFFGLKKKLLERKFPPALVEQEISQNYTIEEELAAARKLLAKKKFFLPVEGGERRRSGKDWSRAAAALRSRGFRAEVARKACSSEEW